MPFLLRLLTLRLYSRLRIWLQRLAMWHLNLHLPRLQFRLRAMLVYAVGILNLKLQVQIESGLMRTVQRHEPVELARVVIRKV